MIQSSCEVKVKKSFSKDWVVLIYNDNTTPIDVVIDVLIDIFDYTHHNALRLAFDVNDKVKGVVGKYPEKLAKSRVARAIEQVHSKGFTDFKMTVVEE